MLILLGAAACLAEAQDRALKRSLSLPTLEDGNEVRFYYLQGIAPYTFGTNYTSNLLSSGIFSHAGLGVWDVTSDRKFSLELIISDARDMFFPDSRRVVIFGDLSSLVQHR